MCVKWLVDYTGMEKFQNHGNFLSFIRQAYSIDDSLYLYPKTSCKFPNIATTEKQYFYAKFYVYIILW